MRFAQTAIDGVLELSIDWNDDERGSFGRLFCRREFEQAGLTSQFVQYSLSRNTRRGTVRGFHLQRAPSQETKLVQCTSGRIFDVALDLRRGSSTFGRYHAVELSADGNKMLYIPEGCAHAYQCLADDTRVIYYISNYYAPDNALGVRWSDPAINVPWPLPNDAIVSERDSNLPTLDRYKD
jgi:dTDP-4-dehydrorhamnose 3,5-epimerase